MPDIASTPGRPFDVCVVGAGPAGLSVAAALLGKGLLVAMVELGSYPGAVETTGEPLHRWTTVGETRGGGLGGTANRWGFRLTNEPGEYASAVKAARYAPLDELDLKARDDIPHTGWPIAHDELASYYPRAHELAGLGPFDYEVRTWGGPDAPALPLDPADVTTSMFQFGPSAVWITDLPQALAEDPQVVVLDGATVVGITSHQEATGSGDPMSTVTSVQVRQRDGSTAPIEARAVVLAAGGLENARLLLDGDGVGGPALGNEHDQVGRYFMEHPLVTAGHLVTDRPAADLARLYDLRLVEDTWAMGKLVLPPQVQEREGLLATSMLFVPREEWAVHRSVRALARLRSPSGRRSSLRARIALALTAARGVGAVRRSRHPHEQQPTVDHCGWATHRDGSSYRVLELLMQTEQSPHPDNRVTLTDGVDDFGRRRMAVHWHWSPEDRQRVARARDRYVDALDKAGIGTVLPLDFDAGHPQMLHGTHHHMGTTRMSADPRTGVVDADCRVHGTTDLFVAGSSVFTTGGFVNPTLSVVALGLRLGDHVAQLLQDEPARRSVVSPGR